MEMNAFKYYEYSKHVDPDMFNLAVTVLATQVSVERAFSALAALLTYKRTRLAEPKIDDIMTINLNNDLLDFVNFHDMS